MACKTLLSAAPVTIPNASFEVPSTVFVSTSVGSWQKLPKPEDYDESGGFLWDQLCGVFRNTEPPSPDHIVNCDGSQALYLFAVPHTGLRIEATGPEGDFPVLYSPGDSLSLTVGVIGGGGNMKEGVSLRLELYVLNDAGDRVTVAATQIVHSATQFPTTTRLIDFQVTVPTVQPTDPWAGRRLGIALLSTVTSESELEGGYWDLDNVRLTLDRDVPLTLTAAGAGDRLRVSWTGVPGLQYQVQTSTNVVSWQDLGVPLDGSAGGLVVELPTEADAATFVRVVSAPRP